MKSYLLTTGLIFGVLAVLHVWRAVAEWPATGASVAFVAGMGALILVPGALAWWAWRLLRALPRTK